LERPHLADHVFRLRAQVRNGGGRMSRLQRLASEFLRKSFETMYKTTCKHELENKSTLAEV
jgi:hypothetical protein